MFACVQLNTDTTGKRWVSRLTLSRFIALKHTAFTFDIEHSVEDSHNAVAAEHGHLRGAVHSAKGFKTSHNDHTENGKFQIPSAECVREQRMRVPQLILKQTDAHLHLLGAVPQVQIKQYFFSPKVCLLLDIWSSLWFSLHRHNIYSKTAHEARNIRCWVKIGLCSHKCIFVSRK